MGMTISHIKLCNPLFNFSRNFSSVQPHTFPLSASALWNSLPEYVTQDLNLLKYVGKLLRAPK